MLDDSGVVTLIFYRIGSGREMLKEPFLNLLAAAFQMSTFTHVEIAIGTNTECTLKSDSPFTKHSFFRSGSEYGSMGQMCNVCRIFNDDVGVSDAF